MTNVTATRRRAEENLASFAHHPRTFAFICGPPGPGRRCTPSLRNSTYNTGWLAPPVRAPADGAPLPITATGRPSLRIAPSQRRSVPSSEQHMIPAAGIKDQELAITGRCRLQTTQPSHGP